MGGIVREVGGSVCDLSERKICHPLGTSYFIIGYIPYDIS